MYHVTVVYLHGSISILFFSTMTAVPTPFIPNGKQRGLLRGARHCKGPPVKGSCSPMSWRAWGCWVKRYRGSGILKPGNTLGRSSTDLPLSFCAHGCLSGNMFFFPGQLRRACPSSRKVTGAGSCEVRTRQGPPMRGACSPMSWRVWGCWVKRYRGPGILKPGNTLGRSSANFPLSFASSCAHSCLSGNTFFFPGSAGSCEVRTRQGPPARGACSSTSGKAWGYRVKCYQDPGILKPGNTLGQSSIDFRLALLFLSFKSDWGTGGVAKSKGIALQVGGEGCVGNQTHRPIFANLRWFFGHSDSPLC